MNSKNSKYLSMFRKLLHVSSLVYHYTPKENIENIKKHGLLINSERSTYTGESNGIYFFKDDNGLIMADVDQEDFDNMVKIVIDIDSFEENIFIDTECYGEDLSLEDFKNEIFTCIPYKNNRTRNIIFITGYVNINIPPEKIFFP